MIEAALIPIPEEEPAHTSENEEEEEKEEEEARNQAPGQNMPPQVDPNAPNAVQPQQLNALLQFDGNRGEAFVNWIECLETAKDTYNWAENSLVQVAKAKVGAALAEWDRGNRQWISCYIIQVVWAQIYLGHRCECSQQSEKNDRENHVPNFWTSLSSQ